MCRCSARRGAIRRIVAREARYCTIRVRRKGREGMERAGARARASVLIWEVS